MIVFWRLFIVFELFLYSKVFQKLDLFSFWHGSCRNCFCKRFQQISRLIFRWCIPVVRTALFWAIRQRVRDRIFQNTVMHNKIYKSSGY